jgi:hypothetical protein
VGERGSSQLNAELPSSQRPSIRAHRVSYSTEDDMASPRRASSRHANRPKHRLSGRSSDNADQGAIREAVNKHCQVEGERMLAKFIWRIIHDCGIMLLGKSRTFTAALLLSSLTGLIPRVDSFASIRPCEPSVTVGERGSSQLNAELPSSQRPSIRAHRVSYSTEDDMASLVAAASTPPNRWRPKVSLIRCLRSLSLSTPGSS